MSLADWLDAGESMLMQGTEDPILIEILGKLTGADDEETMNAAFDELSMLYEVRSQQFRKAADKARRDSDVPRRIGETELERAAAEVASWTGQNVEPEEEPD